MLSKLALRNAKRSFRDYMIYLITVVLSFSFIFSFNMVVYSKDIQELSSMMQNFKFAMIFTSVLVILVIGWLIYYTMRFMLQKRSKEFGTYMLLGIEKKDITKMFLLENFILGLGAFVISFFLGIGMSQLLTYIIMNIFELPYQINISFEIQPILLTVLYFFLIYLFVLWKARKKIKKMKIHDLLYFDKKNEKKIYQTKKARIVVMVVSIVIGICALFLFHQSFEQIMADENAGGIMLKMMGSIILLIVSIYGITLSTADTITTFILNKTHRKYRGNNLFVTRQFASKVRSMGMTMGTLSLLLTMTLLFLNVSNMFKGMFETQLESTAPYDIMVYNLYSDTEEAVGDDSPYTLDDYLRFIEDFYQIEDKTTYNVYTNRESQIRKHISNGLTGYQPFDCYIKLSDYNRLLKMRGMKEITLSDDQYFIHSFRDVSKEIEAYLESNPQLIIGETSLKSAGFTDERYATAWSRGSSYIVIVPDQMIDKNFEIVNQITAIDTKEETTEEFSNQINAKFPPKVFIEDQGEYETLISISQVTVRGVIVSENRSFITILAFCLIYLAFIFIATVGTILAIQTLSDSTIYQYRYTVLKRLGMEQSEIDRAIRKQQFLFFLLPLVYPILISIVTSCALNLVFGSFMASATSILQYVSINILILLFIYSIYFLATYFEFKRNIKG